ncbi:MAG: metallophosphoesterase [Verrucomicrobiae bacterium]|nr:metallophosphoesterase [Verrucomicrobiae bacterium]
MFLTPSLSSTSRPGLRLSRRIVVCSLFLFLFAAATTTHARELKFHGPILQWHREPATEVTMTWVERVAPDVTARPLWKKGPAGFGYGDDDDATEITDMRGHYERIYLARKFDAADFPLDEPLTLQIRYDDAFIAWINGAEVARSPNIDGQYDDADVHDTHEAEGTEMFTIERPSRFLNEGENLITIEVHNARESSSDLTADPSLFVGKRTLIPQGAEWSYLAGSDPGSRWYLKEPKPYDGPELPKEEASEWTLGIRPRDSLVPFESVDIDQREFAETGNPLFEARIQGLRSGTRYEFVLSANQSPVRNGWFTTAPPRFDRPITFVVGGDMGTADAVPISRLAGSLDPLFALVGGDIAYANGREAYKWYDWLDNWADFLVSSEGRSIPIICAIGNHETKGFRIRKSSAPFYFSLFDLPFGESNFAVDFEDYLSILVLDSNHAQDVEDQTGWLGRNLDSRKEVPNLFAIYHRPAWGTGVKGNIEDIQEEWCPLFEKYRLDCVFENDHHVYKRTQKITNGVPDEKNGILYIGDGAWGAEVRPITDRMLERVGARRYLANWAARRHLVKVTLSPDGTKRYEATAPDGEVFDEFVDHESPAPVDGENPASPRNLLDDLKKR